MNKAVVFWSGGKDSAMSLYKAGRDKNLHVTGLVTIFNYEDGKSSVHNLPEKIIEEQSTQIGIPLYKMWVKIAATNTEYEEALLKIYKNLKKEGIDTVIYGDLFLEDMKIYRENFAKMAGMKILFPLWKIDTKQLMEEFIKCGFKAIVCNVNRAILNENLLSRPIDQKFMDQMPLGGDPAGENGEFHTFCFDGPIFQNAVNYHTGSKHFYSCDLYFDQQLSTRRFCYIDIV
ncbi:MAG: diphthine--ammonia ligase [Flavobacterium sp.]|nr:diphthine--ammonia ligase [Pedobacter sp.]